jgi:hypothetical protein
MKQFIKDAMIHATLNKPEELTYFPERGLFFPTTSKLPAIKAGFLPMTGGDTPGGLHITVLQSTEDKLLAYFLLGGDAEALDEALIEAFKEEDKVVIIGTDLNQEVRTCFMVDKFDRQIDQVIRFPKYESEWGIEKVIQVTFQNVKLYDTF